MIQPRQIYPTPVSDWVIARGERRLSYYCGFSLPSGKTTWSSMPMKALTFKTAEDAEYTIINDGLRKEHHDQRNDSHAKDHMRRRLHLGGAGSTMSTMCGHCGGTGFLNVEQVPDDVVDKGWELINQWLIGRNIQIEEAGDCSCHIAPPCSRCVLHHDVVRCDCCGDGEVWYGFPGEHYNNEDPSGENGPYAYNGGLCECH